jgi:hypothetical protein
MSEARAAVVVVALLGAACANVNVHAKAPPTGLRWTGEARVASDFGQAVLGGTALRFRYGARLYSVPEEDSLLETIVGNWGGAELSAGLFSGQTELGHPGSVVLLGGRPWLSRSQRWFLQHQRFSALGLLLPEVGTALGTDRDVDFYLGWDVPLGNKELQVVPGVLWLRPTLGSLWLGTLSLRVPM